MFFRFQCLPLTLISQLRNSVSCQNFLRCLHPLNLCPNRALSLFELISGLQEGMMNWNVFSPPILAHVCMLRPNAECTLARCPNGRVTMSSLWLKRVSSKAGNVCSAHWRFESFVPQPFFGLNKFQWRHRLEVPSCRVTNFPGHSYQQPFHRAFLKNRCSQLTGYWFVTQEHTYLVTLQSKFCEKRFPISSAKHALELPVNSIVFGTIMGFQKFERPNFPLVNQVVLSILIKVLAYDLVY